jgi:hypothetical protein
MAAFVEREREARREAGLRVVADSLLGLAALRATVSREDLAEAGRKAAVVEAFRAEVLQRARRAVHALLDLHAFARDDAELARTKAIEARRRSETATSPPAGP